MYELYMRVGYIDGTSDIFDVAEDDCELALPAIDKDPEMVEWVVIPEGVRCICDSGFKSLCNLNDVSLPNSLNRIGQEAFAHTALKSITIPDNVTNIGHSAFSYCPNLKDVYIGR